MSKNTPIGGQPGDESVFGPALKNKVDKVKEIMGKLSDSLDKVRRGPVSSATEAGFTPDNIDKAKGRRTDVDALEAQLQAQVRENVRVDETLRDVRDQLRHHDSTLAAARELGDGSDETSQELAAEILGWLIQEHPRVRLLVEAIGHEMTPALEQAISRLNTGNPNDPLAARMSQVAAQGPSRDELIGQIDRLESELRSAQEQANAKGVVITSLAEKEIELKDEINKWKRKEVALRNKVEEEVERALESKREAESSESRQRAELCQVKRQSEVIESRLREQNDKLQHQKVQIREFENDRRIDNELKAVNDKHMEDLEAQVRQLQTAIKGCQSSRDTLQSQLDNLQQEHDAKDSHIHDLTAQITGDRERLVAQEDLAKGQRLLIEERDSVRSDLEYYRKLADSRHGSSDKWMKLCEERDKEIQGLDSRASDFAQQFKATKTRERRLETARDNLSIELHDAKQTIQEQGHSIDRLQQSVSAHYNEVKDYADLSARLREQVDQRDLSLSIQRVDLSSKDEAIRERDKTIERLAELNTELKKQLSASEVKIKDLADSNDKMKGQAKSLTSHTTHHKRMSDKYKSALEETKQNHKSAMAGAKQAACTMAKLVMAQCPPGLEWPDIMERVDWVNEVVVALPTQNPWKVKETWSKDPMLAVDERTESLTTLLLLIVASVESQSLVGLVSCLAAVQVRLDEDSECILPVVKLFLDAASVCVDLEGVHAFQIFLLLQVAERIGRAWPEVRDAVDELTHRGGSHELTSSISRSVASWSQGQRLGSLGCATSLPCQDWTLVGFFRNPNGILLLGDSELRWADHDYVEIDENGITVGGEDDEIEFKVEGQDWNWWVEHIL